MPDAINGEEGLIYGLEFQCRALCAVEAETDTSSQFWVGTQSLKHANQVHCLTLDDEGTHLTKHIYNHQQGEVWQLDAHPKDPLKLVSRHSSIQNNACPIQATLLSRPCPDALGSSSGSIGEFQVLTRLQDANETTDIAHVNWMPGSENQIMTLADNRLNLHDINQSKEGVCLPIATGNLEGKGQTKLTTGAWNPHQNCQQFATVNDHTLRGWDVRSMSQVWTLENPGQQLVRSLDFNPNKQYHLATAGDDGYVRFWDTRSPTKPLITRADHSHWVWSVRFNQFHDQLVLTSSSDCHVILSCLATISSEPQGYLAEDEDQPQEEGGHRTNNNSANLEDGILKTFEDHEESVYSAVWSAADPWTFASLSYDGRLVINQVDRKSVV